MIKAEMLNEMNPKLKALLAAGLIGTAGLGAVSCSMPTDDPTIYEQPAPENPGDTEETVTFESLGVSDYAESLARAVKDDELKSLIKDISKYTDLIYKDGFVPIEFNAKGEYEDGQTYIRYIDDTDDADWYLYYVPTSMESDFDAAIAAYNNAQ